jgi:hypothetical protein
VSTFGRYVLLGVLLACIAAASRRAWRTTSVPKPVAPRSVASIPLEPRRPPPPARVSPPNLVLVRGQVVTLDALPIASASVSISRPRSSEKLADVETDEAGMFEAFAPRADLVVTVSAPGFLDVEVSAGAPGDFLAITLRRGAAIIGRVVRADTGEAVEGATIEVDAGFRQRGEEARSDVTGRFRVDGLRPATFRPRARAEGLFGQARDRVWLGEGETSEEILIALQPAATLRGRLELATTSQPCPGGSVLLQSEVAGVAEAIADGAGDVLFPALLPGSYTTYLTCGTHALKQVAPTIDVGDTPSTTRFIVHEQLQITGVLVDESGAPYPSRGVQIEARPSAAPPDDDSGRSAFPGDDGRFVICVLQAGSYRVSASTPAGPLTLHPVEVQVVVGAPAPDVRLVGGVRYGLKGRVVDERGHPVAAALSVQQSPHSDWSLGLGDDGNFEIHGLKAGEVYMSVGLDGDMRDVQPPPLVPMDHPLTLVVPVPSGRIDGHVLASGALRGWTWVMLRRRNGMVSRTRADADGSFSFAVPENTVATLSAYNELGETAADAIAKTGEHVALRLLAPASIRGTVRNAPRAFRVSLRVAGRGDVFFGTRGAFELRDIPPGHDEVEVTAAGLAARVKLTLAPGEARTIEVELARGDLPPGDLWPFGDEDGDAAED